MYIPPETTVLSFGGRVVVVGALRINQAKHELGAAIDHVCKYFLLFDTRKKTPYQSQKRLSHAGFGVFFVLICRWVSFNSRLNRHNVIRVDCGIESHR